MVIYFSLLICLIGLIMYLAAKTNADLKAIGMAMFWVGLLAFLLVFPGYSQHSVNLLGR